MRHTSIRSHLRPYSITRARTTTINHAFAAAIAPCDAYDESSVRDAVRQLGQDPQADLSCVYCGGPAETWDHVRATVFNKRFSGHGHTLGNLLPCCKPCNSKKGNKVWHDYIESLRLDPEKLEERKHRISNYLSSFNASAPDFEKYPEYAQLEDLKQQVLEIFKRADAIAAALRDKEQSR